MGITIGTSRKVSSDEIKNYSIVKGSTTEMLWKANQNASSNEANNSSEIELLFMEKDVDDEKLMPECSLVDALESILDDEMKKEKKIDLKIGMQKDDENAKFLDSVFSLESIAAITAAYDILQNGHLSVPSEEYDALLKDKKFGENFKFLTSNINIDVINKDRLLNACILNISSKLGISIELPEVEEEIDEEIEVDDDDQEIEDTNASLNDDFSFEGL